LTVPPDQAKAIKLPPADDDRKGDHHRAEAAEI
jgi:hypothetical protein